MPRSSTSPEPMPTDAVHTGFTPRWPKNWNVPNPRMVQAGLDGMGSVFTRLLDSSIVETIDVDVIEDGGDVKLQVQADGGGNLTCRFGGISYTLVAPPAEVTLTVGADDANPVLNYVYITESSGVLTLTKSTTGFPSAAHCRIATVLVQTAASVATDGAYKVHVWTDHMYGALGNGMLSHINKKLRALNATWVSGVVPSNLVVDDPDAYISTTAGVVFQLHEHTMPAIDMETPAPVFLVNDPTTAYKRITTFDDITQDASGGGINNKYMNPVLWGAISEKTGDCKLYVNLPTGTYTVQAQADADVSATAVYSFPAEFVGTAFLIARYTLKAKDSGAWEQSQKVDLRGLIPSSAIGGSAAGGDVTGPASATDNAVARFDGATGNVIQNSGVTISDADELTVPLRVVTQQIQAIANTLSLDAPSDIVDTYILAINTGTQRAHLLVSGNLTLAYEGGTGILSGATQILVDNLELNGNTISSTDANGDINLTPNGTGELLLSNPHLAGDLDVETYYLITTGNRDIELRPGGSGMTIARTTGSVKNNTDVLSIENAANDPDMDGTETSIVFEQWQNNPAVVRDSARITVGTEQDWNAAAGSRDSYMALHVSLNGFLDERLRITSDGTYIFQTGAAPTEVMRIQSDGYVGIGETSATQQVTTQRDGPPSGGRGFLSGYHSNDNVAPYFNFQKSRGTKAVPTAIQSGDQVGLFRPDGYDGAAYRSCAYFGFVCDGAVAAGVVPTAFRVGTSTVPWGTERFRVTSTGEVLVGTVTADGSAILECSSTTLGFLPPQMTTAQRNAIAGPAAGLVIFNTTTGVLDFYNGAAWGAV